MNSQLIIDNGQLKGYKKTEVGIIPEDWEVKTLKDISKHKPMYGINASATNYTEDKPRYLRITDIGDDGSLLSNEIKGVNAEKIDDYILEEGDIVFARTGNTTGKSFLYRNKYGELVFAGFLIKFRIDDKVAIPSFVFYCTQTHSYNNWVSVMSQRSGQPGINSEEYSQLSLPIPPLKEQKKIATILSSVDQHIEEVDAMIEDLKELKKGLMQKLLTGQYSFENGKLVKTKEFKETKLGMIPRHWEASQVEGTFDKVLKSKYNQIKNSEYLEDGKYPIIDQGKELVSGYTNKNDSICREDLPIVIFGDHTRIIKYIDFPFAVGADGTQLLKPKSEIFTNKYYYYALRNLNIASQGYKRHFKHLREAYVLIPPLQEQEKIASILSSVDERIELYENKKQDIQELKKGLMQQLLTGKKRVEVN